MSDNTVYALLVTAATTSLLHALIPDHWLPFVLIGRAQRWAAGTVAAVSGLSALIHVVLSLLLGLLAVAAGLTAASVVGETMERVGAGLLVVFGLGYALWAWRKGGHFHPGGSRLHSPEAGRSCSGEEGDANPEHLHYHADDELIRGAPGRGAIGLAVIIGINPCIVILPIMMASVPRGPAMVGLVTLAYSVPTVLLMVGLSVLGVQAGWRIPMPGVARHMESASGLLIAVLGLLYWLFEA